MKIVKLLNLYQMKKLLFIVALLVPVVMYGQWVNGIDLSKPVDFDYIELQGLNQAKMDIKNPSEYRPKIIVTVDFGQLPQDIVLKDSLGNPMVFLTMIGAVNQMSKWGWDFVANYSVSGVSAQIYHYVMRRRKE